MTQRPRMIRRPRQPVVPGFTLIELMLSIALVLILLLGVNKVFQTTGDAVGAGQTLNDVGRDQRAAQSQLFDDFRNALRDPPCFVINSRRVFQYLNQADFQSSVGGNPQLIDLNNDGNAGNDAGETIPPTATNYRSHRIDTVGFFTHGFYHRRTADAVAFSSPTTGDDAFVWIGHAAQPGVHPDTVNGVLYNTATNPPCYGPEYNFPSSNPNAAMTDHAGAYAADYLIARQVLLMRDPASIPTDLLTSPQVQEQYIHRFYPSGSGTNQYAPSPWDFGSNGTTSPPTVKAINLSPLGYNSTDTTNGSVAGAGAYNYLVQSSTYDLAGATIEQFRTYLAEAYRTQQSYPPFNGVALTNGDPFVAWWNPLVYEQGATWNSASNNWAWASNNAASPDSYRFSVNTKLPALTSAALAQMAPRFIEHASQLVIEYAGDYLQQDNNPTINPGNTANPNYGNLTGIGSDGEVDYYLDANKVKHIRWYGLPRDIDGDGTVQTFQAGDAANAINYHSTAGVNFTGYVDTIPLRDYYTLASALGLPGAASGAAPHEVYANFSLPAAAAKGNYADLTSGMGSNGAYVCAWRNDTPAMIRILVKTDDPANRISDGPWFEYVFRLK